MSMSRSGQVSHVFQKDDSRPSLLDYSKDVPVDRSSGLFHALLSSGFAEGLARKTSRQEVVWRKINPVLCGQLRNISQGGYSPVSLVDGNCRRIDLNGLDATASHRRERCMESTDPCE
jgi:hypothetical protein